MSAKLVRVSLLCWLLAAADTCSGPITDASVARLVRLSRLAEQTARLPEIVLAGLEQERLRGTAIPEEEYQVMRQGIREAFDPIVVLRVVVSEIRTVISESEARELAAWYESDLGQRTTAIAEIRESTPAALQQMRQQDHSLLADEERVRLVQRLDELANVTGSAMHLQQKSAIAVFAAISTAMNPSDTSSIQAFKSNLYAQEAAMRATVEKMVCLSLAYSFRKIDLANLREYVAFNERPTTKKFSEAMARGHRKALGAGIDMVAERLAVEFRERRKLKTR